MDKPSICCELSSLTCVYMSPSIKHGRAKWGDSGALYSQSALARLNSSRRFTIKTSVRLSVVLISRSYAAGTCELRQVRKEAAVNSLFWVP